MSTKISPCTVSDFELVKNYIREYELDNRELKVEEFLVMHQNHTLVGFGRVRRYYNFSEMCSLGIVKEFRNKGFGEQLVHALQQHSQQPLYLVTIVPEYFKNYGFKICTHYPKEIENKLNYCVSGLPVEEKYVVMQEVKII